jgi:hypothetical protein
MVSLKTMYGLATVETANEYVEKQPRLHKPGRAGNLN